MYCWVFDGEPISWNHPFFLIILLDSAVSLKVFVDFKLTWFRFLPTKFLLDACSGGMRCFNKLALGTILLIFHIP